MAARQLLLCATIAAAAASVAGSPAALSCSVRARTDAGWVCGLARWADRGAVYASFRGVPYATQPLGDRRFQELEPPEPWDHLLDATEEGPVCYQSDVIYGPLMQPRGMSEACIHANVHVPLEALPGRGAGGAPLPVLVFVHGGGFMSGSGDADLHGPEYLVANKVLVITFNYRLNIFGFLSLNSSAVPGNQGLRDMVTLLRWVRRNARAFGGDPDNVTLMGQSAGAVAAHLLTLSDATKGLFKRAFLMSGTAISGFYSPSPLFAQTTSSALLSLLGINSTNVEEIHRRLVDLPAEELREANRVLLDRFGLTTFVPRVEERDFPGVTRVLDDYPAALMARGRGAGVPLVVGFTDAECDAFRPRLEQIDIAARVAENPVLTVPVDVIYSTPPDRLPTLADKVEREYYNGTIDTQGFISYCTAGLYQYPALRLAALRSDDDADLFLYRFSYSGERSAVREALRLPAGGAAHIEDLTYVFRPNALPPAAGAGPDQRMKDWMTDFVVNFMHCSSPVCDKKWAWPATSRRRPLLQEIARPAYRRAAPDAGLGRLLHFFDQLS